MNFMSTVKGSALEGFYPQGWNMKKIDECCEKGTKKEAFWNKKFKPVACDTVADLDTYMRSLFKSKRQETEARNLP